MTPDKFDAKAREIMESLTTINSHLGYQFTQPIMAAKKNIAQALRDADQAGYRRAQQEYEIKRLQIKVDALAYALGRTGEDTP